MEYSQKTVVETTVITWYNDSIIRRERPVFGDRDDNAMAMFYISGKNRYGATNVKISVVQ